MEKLKKAIRKPIIIRPVIFFVLLALLTPFTGGALAADAPGTTAQSCILAEAESGTVLYEKNVDSKMLIASTTKILTALVVLDKCDPREQVVIADDFPPVEGSSMYLKPGETLTVSELLYGLMLASGNDAALALALYVSGSVEAFAQLMNTCSSALGCTGSHFVNPHGLDADEHYSTARDLWLIAREAMKNETFTEIVSTKYMSVAGRSLKNHNKLLWNCQGVLGIKTGYTESAGRSLVSCAEREGMRLICVTLNAPDDWTDHTALYDWAYTNYRIVSIFEEDDTYGTLPVISGMQNEVPIRAVEDFTDVYKKSDDIQITVEAPMFVYAPVVEGERAGDITVKKDGKTIKTIALVYGDTVALDKSVPLTQWEKLRRLIAGEKNTVTIYSS